MMNESKIIESSLTAEKVDLSNRKIKTMFGKRKKSCMNMSLFSKIIIINGQKDERCIETWYKKMVCIETLYNRSEVDAQKKEEIAEDEKGNSILRTMLEI